MLFRRKRLGRAHTYTAQQLQSAVGSWSEMTEPLWWLTNHSCNLPRARAKKIVSLGLCQGRHNIPVGEYIYGEIADPTDTGALDAVVSRALSSLSQGDGLHLYVTGLTVALGATVKYCAKMGIALTLWHYDKVSGGTTPRVYYKRVNQMLLERRGVGKPTKEQFITKEQL